MLVSVVIEVVAATHPRASGPDRRRAARSPLRSAFAAAFLVAATAGASGDRAAPASAAGASALDFDRIFAEDAAGALPSQLAWAPDGRRLGYLWDDGSGEALWILDIPSGSREAVLRLADLPSAPDAEDDTRPSGAGHHHADESRWQWMSEGAAVLLEAAGDLHLLTLADRALRPLTVTAAAESNPRPSPDGRLVAFVREHDLWLLDVAEGTERALTSDGEEGSVLNGETDWVYWEEIWNRTASGHWWSPDGRRLAFYRFEEDAVPSYPLSDPLPTYPAVTWQRYPKAGQANPRVRIGIAEVATGSVSWLDTGDDPDAYLARVAWTADGEAVAVARLDRDQTRLDLLRCDPRGGPARTLRSESWPTWINLHDHLRFLADGRFLWSSEKSGWRRLYLHATDGSEIAAISPEGWAVTSLDAVDESAAWAMITAFPTGGLGAARRQVLRIPLAGGEADELTPAAGWHSATASDSGLWVHSASDADTPPALAVRDAGGAEVATLPSRPPADLEPAALPRWEILAIPGPDGVRLPAAMLKPPHFDPSRRYPVILYHYGCPASQVVADQWGRRTLWHKLMAERGYLVFQVDNQASTFFGKAGEDLEHRRFGTVHLPALRAAADYLAGLPYADQQRIGIWGWSGGGSNTLAALVGMPGVFRAGVAGAPVTDWRLYDSIWTERYLDRPQENAEGYAASSPLTAAADLADPLLIVHGTADDNVHSQNTLVMADALTRAGKPFEMAIYPGQKHAFVGPAQRHFYERMTEFFDRHLRSMP